MRRVRVRSNVVGTSLEGVGGPVRRHFRKTGNNIYGHLEFLEDGLFFAPYRLETLAIGVTPQFLATWDDVAALDLEAMFGTGASLTVFHLDRTRKLIGGVNRHRCEEALTSLAFEPHERPSWPNHRLFTRPPSDPDWSLLGG